jgi:Outer membrane protein beta-barrel domain
LSYERFLKTDQPFRPARPQMYQIMGIRPKPPFAPDNKKLIFGPVFTTARIQFRQISRFSMIRTKPTSSQMIRSALVLLTFLSIASLAQAQTATKSRPNIPGSFIVDLGLNGTIGSPDLWKQGLWGSRTLNLYYQYPIRFGRTRFSFNPGIGVSLERFKWKEAVTLTDPREANANAQVEKYEFIDSRLLFPNPKKTMFINNYLEIPLEIRFDTKPEDIGRSFNVALGVRGGWLFDSSIKMKYKEDGQTKKNKDKQDWGTTQFRYGVYSRVGIGGFNVFGFYNLTPLFQKDLAPSQNGTLVQSGANIGQPIGTTTPTTMTTFTIGISINGF